MHRRIALTLTAACAAAFACAPIAEAAAPLTPTAPVSAQVPKFQQAITDQSCDELIPLITTISSRPPGTQPGAPPAAGECDAQRSLFSAWAGYKPARTKGFGTAALVDGQLNGVKEQVWILDSDGVYRFLEGLAVSKSDLAFKFAGRTQATAAASDLVGAIRGHNCNALNKVTLSNGPLASAFTSRKQFCKTVLGGSFASELKATPKAKPVFEGGTGGIAFYYVKTKHALVTVYVGRVRGGKVRYGVLDYAFNQRS